MFDRFSPACRFPVGAVKHGTSVRFTLTPPRSLGVKEAFLEENGTLHPLIWTDTRLGEDVYTFTLETTAPGLHFYTFLLDTADGRFRLSENGRQSVLRKADEYFVPFQLTVYDASFTTPDFLKGGVIYQIFPDRFFRAGTRLPTRGRTLHANWSDPPDYHNDPLKITNSDFFGGDLQGITQKLDYLVSLGVTVIYLNPIFEAYSNHRYDTGDYETIDPLLGDEDDLRTLFHEAKKRGIAVLLDGVFSHTGADSRYFNKFGTYESLGAAQSTESPYASWYDFQRFPDRYTCWWDVWSLPCVNETQPSYLDFITGENGIARRYIRLGASGWRLDVADELPDGFLDAFRKAVKAEDPDAAVLGEVWEDASNKIAYGTRRRYLLGDQLDSVMNYPFRSAVLAFVKDKNAAALVDTVLAVTEHYPPCVTAGLMNLLSTHDTPRILTALAGEGASGRDRDFQARTHIPPERLPASYRKLLLAAAVQYTLPGTPSLYYGDETGMQGYGDPFNRAAFPWGRENAELVEAFRFLGKLRAFIPADAPFTLLFETEHALCYRRGGVTVYANASETPVFLLDREIPAEKCVFVVDGKEIPW